MTLGMIRPEFMLETYGRKILANNVQEINLFDQGNSRLPELSISGLIPQIGEQKNVFKKLVGTKIFLNKCLIKMNMVQDYKSNLFLQSDRTEIMVMIEGDYIVIYNRKFNTTTVVNMRTREIGHFGKNAYRQEVDVAAEFAVKVIAFYNELAHAEKDIIKVEKQRIKGKSGKKVKKESYSIDITNYKRYIYDSQNNTPKRKYERHTEHWGVRGHWRTYKSGKRVWIKPGTRGDKSKPLNKQVYTGKGR